MVADRQVFLTIAKAHPEEPLAVDTETTGLFVKDGRDHCIGISASMNHPTEPGHILKAYWPIAHPCGDAVEEWEYEKLVQVIESADCLIFANAKFDLFSLETAGIYPTPSDFIDICVLAQMYDENRPRRKGLDELAMHYLDRPGKVKDPYVDYEKVHGNQRVRWFEEWDYACTDAESTLEIAQELLSRIDRDEPQLWGLWEIKQREMLVTMSMERRGIRVDVPLAEEVAAYGREEMARLTKAIGKNPGSPKQLGELLIEDLGLPVVKKTPKGAPSFDKDAMEVYEQMLERLDNPLATQIKEYRGWQKAVTASFEPYVELLSPDGRLRTSFNFHRTVTGRLSSSEPNLQQIPKESDKPWKEFTKQCFIPEDGYVLINADYSQLELRLGTVYAQEPHLIEVFREGRDIFTEMAQALGFDRQTTKTFVYSTQYGAGEQRIMSAFGVSRERARQMLRNYRTTYARFAQFSDMCAAKAEQAGKVKLWSGRYRHFQYESESFKAMNSVIQGGAADIVGRVMIRLYDELDSDECRLLLQVHDAFVFEVREDLAEDYMGFIKEIMEDLASAVGHHEFDTVPFNVEVELGYGSAH